MDASDHSRDLLELAVIAAWSPLIGGWGSVLVVLLAGTQRAASSSTASSTTPASPTAAASTLAVGWAFARNVTNDAAVVAAVQTNSISSAMLPDS